LIDVGAHIGKYAVLGGRLLSGRGRVIAIEPDPENFRALENNVRLNGLTNLELRNVGCWSQNGVLSLHKGIGNLGEHSFVEVVGPASISVQVRTLDSIVSELGVDAVDVLKIDVQRAEAEVLKGASHVLGESSALSVILEEMGDPETAESLQILRDNGFKIRRLDVFNYLAER